LIWFQFFDHVFGLLQTEPTNGISCLRRLDEAGQASRQESTGSDTILCGELHPWPIPCTRWTLYRLPVFYVSRV